MSSSNNTSPYAYSTKLKQEFEPVLKFFEIKHRRDELAVLVRDIGEALGDSNMANISDKQLQEAFQILDEDGSGEIEWTEFKDWFDELMGDNEEQQQ
ncbi:hypothetical protein ABK040_012601 [Willaertia magna]